MPYRLVALDIDGTLVTKDQIISQANLDAIRLAQQAGVLVTLATGRMFNAARPVARQLEIDLPIITYQGSVIRRALSGETLFRQDIDTELAMNAVRHLEGATGRLFLYVEDLLVAAEDDAVTQRYRLHAPEVELCIAQELSNWLYNQGEQRALTKLAYIAAAENIDALLPELERRFSESLELTRTYPGFLEIGPKGIHKGSALAWLAQHFEIPLNETLVIGDSANDIDMFKVAGLAVAMGDAQPEAKAAAHALTADCAADGVALALRRYLL